MVCPALCFLPRFGDHAFEMKASDVSEMQPLLIHSSLAAAVPFGFLGPCSQFILVSRVNKSHSYCFLSDGLVMPLLPTYSLPGFFFFPFFFLMDITFWVFFIQYLPQLMVCSMARASFYP